MKRFKYNISDKKDLEGIWVCAACKKLHTEEILSGKWKLIDIEDEGISCEVCEDDKKTVKSKN